MNVGDFRTALLFAASSWLLFIAVGAALFVLLATDNAFKREIKDLFGGLDIGVRPPLAAAIILPACLLACAWSYRSKLATRFVDVIAQPAEGSMSFEFFSPLALSPIIAREDEIASWTSQVDWVGRTPRRTLVVNLKNGGHLKSLAANPRLHQDAVKRLEGLGVQILK